MCFTEPDIDGKYLDEAEYGFLFGLAPNIRYAFEGADQVFSEARKDLERKIRDENNRTASDLREIFGASSGSAPV